MRRFLLAFVASTFVLSLPVQAELSDPTQPPQQKRAVVISPKQLSEKWKLSYTLVSEERSVAVINGKVVAVGDTMAGARIQSIDSSGVTLRRAGKRIRLELLPKGSTPKRKESDTP